MNDLLKTYAKDLVILAVMCVGAYFTIQANTQEIVELKEDIVELEKNKVSVSAMDLKEHFLSSELQRIGEEIKDFNNRLDKKIKIINEQNQEIITLQIQVAVQRTEINQAKQELKTVWSNYNRINCK